MPDEPKKDILGDLHYSIVTTMVRGAIASIPIQPEIIIFSMCRAFGRVMGEIYGGDEEAVVKFRNEVRRQFSQTLHQTPTIKPPSKAMGDPKVTVAVPVDQIDGEHSPAPVEVEKVA